MIISQCTILMNHHIPLHFAYAIGALDLTIQ